MLKLADAGVSDIEIAWRFRRTPKSVRQVLALARLPRASVAAPPADRLRPIERRVLRWRDGGTDIAEVASRFRKRPVFVEQVEQLARYKLAR